MIYSVCILTVPSYDPYAHSVKSNSQNKRKKIQIAYAYQQYDHMISTQLKHEFSNE